MISNLVIIATNYFLSLKLVSKSDRRSRYAFFTYTTRFFLPYSTFKRVKSLVDIYETCNMIVIELEYYEEAKQEDVMIKALQE